MDSSPLTVDFPTVNMRAEFKPLLSTVNISIEFSRSLAYIPSRITLQPKSISLQSEVLNVDFPIEGIALKPVTCRGLRWMTSRELHMSVGAEWLNNGGGDADSHQRHKQFNPEERLVSRITACQSRCFCVGCGAQILKPSCQFKRIMPLPSENWADFADIWFCHHHHGHGGDTNEETDLLNGHSTDKVFQMENRSLSPRPDDCLVSSLYMLVTTRHVKPCAVSCVTGKLICKRCGNFLGFVKSAGEKSGNPSGNDVYKIYFHTICFRKECEDVPLFKNAVHQGMKSNAFAKSTSEQPIEEFICHLLKDQSHRFTSFRFIIDSSMQDDAQTGVIILLWLLDQDLTVFSFSSSQKLCAADSETSYTLSNLSGHPRKLMKVLYKVQFHSSNPEQNRQSPDVFKAWGKDNTVHGLSLPYPLCKQLVALLIDSTKNLSASQRNLNGFHVGYLKSS